MLKPAILYKEELLRLFAEHVYDSDMLFYTGYRYCFTPPDLDLADNEYRWVMVNKDNKVIGYLSYRVDDTSDTVHNFGLFSFDRGNPIIGKDLFEKMDELVKTYRRIEWRCIGGNPVEKHYDAFIKKHNGYKAILHKVLKDHDGNYIDDYIYGIVKDN